MKSKLIYSVKGPLPWLQLPEYKTVPPPAYQGLIRSHPRVHRLFARLGHPYAFKEVDLAEAGLGKICVAFDSATDKESIVWDDSMFFRSQEERERAVRWAKLQAQFSTPPMPPPLFAQSAPAVSGGDAAADPSDKDEDKVDSLDLVMVCSNCGNVNSSSVKGKWRRPRTDGRLRCPPCANYYYGHEYHDRSPEQTTPPRRRGHRRDDSSEQPTHLRERSQSPLRNKAAFQNDTEARVVVQHLRHAVAAAEKLELNVNWKTGLRKYLRRKDAAATRHALGDNADVLAEVFDKEQVWSQFSQAWARREKGKLSPDQWRDELTRLAIDYPVVKKHADALQLLFL